MNLAEQSERKSLSPEISQNTFEVDARFWLGLDSVTNFVDVMGLVVWQDELAGMAGSSGGDCKGDVKTTAMCVESIPNGVFVTNSKLKNRLQPL